MPFEKVDSQADFPAQERAVLAFWEQSRAFDLLRAKNKGKPRWSFLDGPITANNPMGVHHAWGRTYKDAYQRFFAMTGHELRYQNGFDCQGLWVEVEVEKSLNLKSKRDIENLVPGDRFASIDRFVSLCKERVDRFARVQTEQTIRLGNWMDWDRTDEDWAKSPDERRSYFTMSEENNYTIWGFLKRCHERGLVYKGFDAMPWCPRCGVGISQMEMNEGYRVVAHRAVFVRFPLRDRPGESLLAWTTTPWTLAANVAAAVNPTLTYLRVRVGEHVVYVAKGAFKTGRLEDEFKDKEQWVAGVPKLKTLEQLFKEKKGGFEVLGELPGSEMVGWRYDGPFDDLPAQKHPAGYPADLSATTVRQGWAPAGVSAAEAHRVVAWDEVGETEGTGIVHIAPGCGTSDFALGKEQRLPPVAPLAEDGLYLEGFGPLAGQQAASPETAERVLALLTERGLLFASEKYPHRYPHCWRCKTELLYRHVDEWFIGMSWRDEIIRVCDDIKWIPENGHQQEVNWLQNMGDWMISKKRFWGLALPIWVDPETGHFEVIGSREELKERAVEGWEQFEGHPPHRPWIDLVKIRNPKTGNLMSRIPDVGNPWLDAGIVPFSTMGYRKNPDEWAKWFPADFITESFPGQFRNWFYSLLAMSTMLTGRAPFKALLGHGLVRDQNGKPMHKSEGNAIEFNEAADDMGADVMRWLYCRSNPSVNIKFGHGPANEVRSTLVLKLWNTYALFCNYAVADGVEPATLRTATVERSDLDRYILSELRSLVAKAHEAFAAYNVQAFCLEAEKFVDDKLSNWYVRRSRRRFWRSRDEGGADKLAAYQTLYTVLTTVAKLFAPVMPFVTETMWQNLRQADDPVSVHLCDYPKPEELSEDARLSDEVNALLELVTLGMAARNAAKVKVRQPLAELRLSPATDAARRAVERFADQLRDELNVKRVTLATGPLLTAEMRPAMKTFGPKFQQRMKEVQAALAALGAQAVADHFRTKDTLTVETPSGPAEVAAADVTITYTAGEGFAGAADRIGQALLDVRITPELRQEGLARDIVRLVQEARKAAGLQPEDRIALAVTADVPEVAAAVQAQWAYICRETLADAETTPGEGDGVHTSEAKVEGAAVRVTLRRQ